MRIETERGEKLKEAMKIFATVFHSGGYILYSFSKSVFYIRPLFYGCAVHNKELLLLVARNLLLFMFIGEREHLKMLKFSIVEHYV